MKADRWQRVEQLYHSTLEKEVSERAAFLAEACAGDEGLQREVESLLAYEDGAKDFIESPALEVAAKIWLMLWRHCARDPGNHTRSSPFWRGRKGAVTAQDALLERRVRLVSACSFHQ